MSSYPRNYPFYNWVPKWLGILILVLMFIPILTVGGVYSVNSTEMMSGLGIISEHITFTNFATSIGMAAFCPFLYRLVVIRREKMMCLAGFSMMYVLSYICAETDSIFLLALCSVLMGFLRMVLMMVNLFTLILYAGRIEAYLKIKPGLEPADGEGWDKLDIERSIAQPGIYLFFMILGQLGTSLTAWLAYEYEWQYVYYYMMGMLLVCILVIFVTMPYHRFQNKRFPINFRQFGNATLFCIPLVCFTYVMVYGKVLDWWDDTYYPHGCDYCSSYGCFILLYGIHTPQSVLSGGRAEVAHHSYGSIVLFFANVSQFQRHVCQCVCRHWHETG